jgi:heme exporter protein C
MGNLVTFVYGPTAAAAVLAVFAAALASVGYLRTKALRFDSLAVAATEVGLLFLTVNVLAGAVWTHTARGVWWTWDPAIASALICVLLYASYLMLRRAVEEPSQRAAFCAVWSVFCLLDSPLIVVSVYRWRGEHPHPALWSDWASIVAGKPAIGTAAMLLIGWVLVLVLMRRETARREQDSRRRSAQTIG